MKRWEISMSYLGKQQQQQQQQQQPQQPHSQGQGQGQGQGQCHASSMESYSLSIHCRLEVKITKALPSLEGTVRPYPIKQDIRKIIDSKVPAGMAICEFPGK